LNRHEIAIRPFVANDNKYYLRNAIPLLCWSNRRRDGASHPYQESKWHCSCEWLSSARGSR
jgi:hypothetical protein